MCMIIRYPVEVAGDHVVCPRCGKAARVDASIYDGELLIKVKCDACCQEQLINFVDGRIDYAFEVITEHCVIRAEGSAKRAVNA